MTGTGMAGSVAKIPPAQKNNVARRFSFRPARNGKC
jgi:hypothetical protein